MARSRFEEFARLAATGAGRRDVLRGLTAIVGAAGFTFAQPAIDEVAAKKKRRHKHKHKKKPRPIQCQSGQVLCADQCVEGVCCPHAPCGSGNCTCGTAIEGDAFCVANVIVECGGCTSSDDCSPTERCVETGGDAGSGCCFPECGTVS